MFKSLFEKLLKNLELNIITETKRIEMLSKMDTLNRWNMETGEKFNDIIDRYPIS
jgi:hypothetical protein